MITAANDTESIREALKLGITDYLIKPFKYERFAQALDKYLLKHKFIENGTAFTQADLDKLLHTGQVSEKAKKSSFKRACKERPSTSSSTV